MKNYKQMPYNLPDDYIEMAKVRAKAAIAQQTTQQRSYTLYYRIATVAAAICIGVAALGIMRNSDESVSYEDFKAQLQDVPTEILYEISCDMIEYDDEYSQL